MLGSCPCVVPIFEVPAPRVDLRSGSAVCCVPHSLKWLTASHRELVRLRVRCSQPVDSLRPSPALANALPLV